MHRRAFIQRAFMASAASVFLACRRGVTKAEVLRALVLQVVVPNTAALAESSRRLEREIARLAAEPGVATLLAAREQWQRTLLGWKRAEVFRNGPIMDTNSLLRVTFWPVRISAIDALVQSAQAIDDASIDAMGVDRRGLFALEHLLYSASHDEAIAGAFSGPTGERRARLATALAKNISLYADQVVRALGTGKAYADQFADGGQDSLNRLIGQLVYTVENVSTRRFSRVAGLAKSGQLKPTALEASDSRMSQQIALTDLRAAEQLYLGVERGLTQLVQALSSPVDARLRASFRLAIASVSSLGLPLEEVAKQNPTALEASADAVKKLERALRTELASTLGVTLTFSSVDGD